MKRLHTHSQNFLRSPRFAKELIGHTSIKRSEIVYDIGAGSGVITTALAGRCKQVVAIEVEPKTAELLRKNMAHFSNVTVLEADFLSLPAPKEDYKIFANIPFHLSSQILRKITISDPHLIGSYLIVQKQFANKLLPDYSGFSSQLGMILGIKFAVRIRKRLKRTDFWPHPNVDTVLLEIIPRNTPLIPLERHEAYTNFIETYFTNPEKFKKLFAQHTQKDTDIKPSSLTLENWVALFSATQ